jgi:pyrimidine operon attenuation protein/uracil phosphoribosyltransferase
MTKAQKILLVVGILGVAFGGFVLAKYLTRNIRKIRGGTVTLQTYDTPPSEEPLSE